MPEDGDLASMVRQNPILHEKLRILLTSAGGESLVSSQMGGKSERNSILVPWHALQEVSDDCCGALPTLHDYNSEEDDRSTRVPSRESNSPREERPKPGALLAPGLAATKPQLQKTPLLAGLEVDEKSEKATSAKSTLDGMNNTKQRRRTSSTSTRKMSSTSSVSSRCSSTSSASRGVYEAGQDVLVTVREASVSAVVMSVERASRTTHKYKVRTSAGDLIWVQAESLQPHPRPRVSSRRSSK